MMIYFMCMACMLAGLCRYCYSIMPRATNYVKLTYFSKSTVNKDVFSVSNLAKACHIVNYLYISYYLYIIK